MDGFSILDTRAWDSPACDPPPEYVAGNALGWLYRSDKQAATNHPLVGRLYVAKSGWLLLSVPNALVRGVYDALAAPGVELPLAGVMNVPNVASDVLNAHISVMTADEVKKIGSDNITERGHMFGYALGALKEITPKNIDGVSKVWAVQVSAPALSAIRKSYGLSPLINDHSFHITVAVRRKKILQDNRVRKAAAAAELSRSVKNDLLAGGKADNLPDREFSTTALAEGTEHEHEHTDNDQVAKEIAEDHLQEDPAYYEKQKELEKKIEKDAASTLIQELRDAKEHSDRGRFPQKHEILRRLMAQHPDDWYIDDEQRRFKGITHKPTKFKFHTDPNTIPINIKAALARIKESARSKPGVYEQQLYNMYSLRRPFRYDFNKSFLDNAHNTARAVKSQGDFRLRAERNFQSYRAANEPNYRYQLALKAMNNELEEPAMTDQLIQRYGDDFLNTAFGRPK